MASGGPVPPAPDFGRIEKRSWGAPKKQRNPTVTAKDDPDVSVDEDWVREMQQIRNLSRHGVRSLLKKDAKSEVQKAKQQHGGGPEAVVSCCYRLASFIL